MSSDLPGCRADGPAGEIAANLVEITQGFNRLRATVHNAAPGEGDGLLNHLLFQVVRHGPLRASELAENTQADPSTVSRQVDGRASLLHATADGVAHKERLTASRNAHFSELLAEWSDDDQRRFAALLARFNDDFARYRETWLTALIAAPSEPRKATA